jgi:hypothetical protein
VIEINNSGEDNENIRNIKNEKIEIKSEEENDN